jgi:hypothetical protein
VGGDHYRLMKIQPSHFIRANNLGWYEGNIVKYICRHASKGKKLDVEKVIHYAQLLLEEYDDTAQADASLPSRSG